MRLFQHLDEKLQHMDRELATNPQYVQKVSYYSTESNCRSPGLQDELSVKCVNGTLFLKKQGARVTKLTSVAWISLPKKQSGEIT